MTCAKMTQMKQPYFTEANLEEKTREFLEKTAHLRQERIPFQPGSTALLVLDMQRYFLDGSSHAFIPSGAVIIPGIRSLVEVFHAKERPAVFTRHVNTPENAGSMGRWWKDLIIESDETSQVIPELDIPDRVEILKPQYDAFHGTNLLEYLQEQDVTQVVVSGVMTHLCCETTARSAFMHGFDVFFLVDGTATYNQDFHLSTMTNLAHGFASLVTVSEILAEMENGQ